MMTDVRTEVLERRSAVIEAGKPLRDATVERRAAWLADAADRLEAASPATSRKLSASTGLSEPMVSWALRTTLATIDTSTLARFGLSVASRGAPLRWLPLVLAGNVFTASVRGLWVPLLLGVPVLAKASSKEVVFPRLLCEVLRAADPLLGKALDVVSFRGGDAELERTLIGDAESVAVYGTDETVANVRARYPAVHVIAHGHGVSVGYVGRSALDADETIEAVSLDVCAYDQRGCLSPQAVYVRGDLRSAERFGERLARQGLARLSTTLPRGPLPIEVGAAQTQWRGLAEVEGRVFRGDQFAVAVVEHEALRWSPGFRNVSVVPISSHEAALEAWETHGSTLKCVGVDFASLEQTSDALARSASLSAYACALGTMQTPPFDALADGQPAWVGLRR